MTLSENIARLTPSATVAVSTLARKLAAAGRDIINLSAGEPDFDTPEWISSAAIEGIRGGRTRYTPAAGLPELRAAAARYMTAGTDYPAEAARVVVSAGAKQSLFNACFLSLRARRRGADRGAVLDLVPGDGDAGAGGAGAGGRERGPRLPPHPGRSRRGRDGDGRGA